MLEANENLRPPASVKFTAQSSTTETQEWIWTPAPRLGPFPSEPGKREVVHSDGPAGPHAENRRRSLDPFLLSLNSPRAAIRPRSVALLEDQDPRRPMLRPTGPPLDAPSIQRIQVGSATPSTGCKPPSPAPPRVRGTPRQQPPAERGSRLPSSGWAAAAARVSSAAAANGEGLERVPWRSHHRLSFSVAGARARCHGQAGMVLRREEGQGRNGNIWARRAARPLPRGARDARAWDEVREIAA